MSRSLGISRAAVWKAVEALRQEGYVSTSAPNRGYSLQSAPDRLREGELSGPLADCHLGIPLLCFESIDSTNTECKRQAMTGAPDGLVAIAEEQTGGKGRKGRTFQSPKGGLYLSLLLRPDLPPVEVTDITAWVAVAVCDGIEAACGVRPQIKWTNDLVLNGKKLCGILTEIGLEGESHALDYLVPGIGINVAQTPEDFGPELAARTSFRTINGVCASIISLYERSGHQAFRLITDESILRGLLRDIWLGAGYDFPTEGDLRSVATAISSM